MSASDVAMPWIRKARPEARFRLFCFPYAGGGTVEYRSWAPHFPTTVDVCPIILPGRETRLGEAARSEMAPLVSELTRAIAPLLRSTPFAFTGHSMGAWVAFEVARELRRTRLPLPEHLFVAARRAPHLPDALPLLYGLPRAQFIAGVQQRYRAIPQQLLDDPELMGLFLPTLRADFTLLDTYSYTDEAPLDVPLHALRGRQDHVVTRDELTAWSQHTTRDFAARDLPGGHFFLKESRDLLIGVIKGALHGRM